MIVTLERLIDSLRNELQQYGEMLALLDHQQELVRQQGADEILHSISAIDLQSNAIQAARASRQLAQRELSGDLQQPLDSTFAHLMPLILEQYRPLVTALVQENNELLQRVRDRAQQNHHLLRHSMQLMQRFITTLSPQDAPPAALAVEPGSPLYQAIA